MNTIRPLAGGCALVVALLGCWAMRDAGRASDALRLAQAGVPQQFGFPGPGHGGGVPTPPRSVPTEDIDRQTILAKRIRSHIEEGVAPEDRGCLPWTKIPDYDDDFRRFDSQVELATLRSPNLCFTYDAFEENGFPWLLQVIQNTAKRKGPLWAVPHDNENAAFLSAAYSVINYGGTVVAVETGGFRNMLGRNKAQQDPNRNFDTGENVKSACRQQMAPSPEYTKRFLRWWDRSQPIIALHTNTGGTVTIKTKDPHQRAFPAVVGQRSFDRAVGARPDNTLIYVASIAAPEQDPNLMAFVRELNQRGINVVYELVSPDRNDCSLSNYAALQGIRNYINIEVWRGDTETQLRIVDIVMALLRDRPIGELALPGASPTNLKPELSGPGQASGPVPPPRAAPQQQQQQQKPPKTGAPTNIKPPLQ